MSGTIFLADPKNEVARNSIFGRDLFEFPISRIGHKPITVARTTFRVIERGCCVDAGHRLPRTVGIIPTATSIQVYAIAEVVVGGGALKCPLGILPLW